MKHILIDQTKLWAKLEEHRRLGHNIDVIQHVCGGERYTAIYTEYIVSVLHPPQHPNDSG